MAKTLEEKGIWSASTRGMEMCAKIRRKVKQNIRKAIKKHIFLELLRSQHFLCITIMEPL